MRVVLGWLEAAATRRPGRVVVGLVVATVAAAVLATGNQLEVDLTQLGSEDSEAVRAMDRVREDFADPAATVQVLLDAGPDGDLLSEDGLAAVAAAEDVALGALGPAARDVGPGQPRTTSLRSLVALQAEAPGVGPDEVGDVRLGELVARAVAANPQVAGLLSDDVDLDAGTARGTVVLVPLEPTLSDAERTAAAEDVRDAFRAVTPDALDDVAVTVSSDGLFVADLVDAIRAEVPVLFGLALLVVLTILALTYRSWFDVAVGFAGLVATVAWTLGAVALLGPTHLGWLGPLTQLAVIVPVLLVGLGIDYSVHLTARYREQRIAGQAPTAAAARALRTVGAALVLATAATAIGFASIATAPLRMLADFGVAVAVGVVCAFVVMTLLVPAALVLRDRRRGATERVAVRELGLGAWLRGPARLARRRPAAGLVVASVLAALSLVAAARLEVDFDRDDFIPEGSPVADRLALQEALFGGGLSETTFVVVDGDLTEPSVANAVWDAQRVVGEVDGVRTVGGTAQVASVVDLAAGALQRGAGTVPSGAWTGDGFASEADLATVYASLREVVGDGQVDALLAEDASAAVVRIRTTVGDSGAERVRREVAAAFAPVEAAGAGVTVTSEPIVIAEMSDDLSAFQIRSIALTLAVVLLLLVGYEAVVRRRPGLGAIALVPATVGAALVLGTMWALGFAFNVLTATLTAIAVGIGVPYGVHVVNRFVEDRDGLPPGEAIGTTLASTGGALAGSAVTTLGAFTVLAFSGLPPIRSLGLLGGAGIAFAFLAAVLVQPGALVLWERRQDRHTHRDGPVPSIPHPVTSEPGGARRRSSTASP